MQFHTLMTWKTRATIDNREGNFPLVSQKLISPTVAAKLFKLPAVDFSAAIAQWWQLRLENLKKRPGGPSKTDYELAHPEIDLGWAEYKWWKADRPYFNVYPVLNGLIESLPLDVEWQAFRLPFPNLAVCFPKGAEPYGIASALFTQGASGKCGLFYQPSRKPTGYATCAFGPEAGEQTLEESFKRCFYEGREWDFGEDYGFNDCITSFLIRLMSFIGVLKESDRAALVTEVILRRDEHRYAETVDEALRRRLFEAASRVNGKGFHLGRTQQEHYERGARTPHERRAHWHKYWVGPGRQQLSVKWVDRITVLAKELVEVPSGMLGPENENEMQAFERLHCRIPLPKRVRFLILRRDSYTCQLCGKRAPDVVLEIDHKAPVSLGGSNSEENLWVLCFDCNRGRSNLPM